MVTQTTAYSCNQCGGTASVVSGRSYLQCNYCHSLVFAEDSPAAVDRITPINRDVVAGCPCCQGSLQTGQIEGRNVMYCGRCFGVLVRNADFGFIVRERRARRRGCEVEAGRPLDTSAYERQINCPVCSAGMEVHPYYGPGNVVIDSCDSCHYVWLDHGELRTVERSSGSRVTDKPDLPVYVNGDGEVVVVSDTTNSRHDHSESAKKSPLLQLAEMFFDLPR